MDTWTLFGIFCGFLAIIGLGGAALGTYLDNKEKGQGK